jgi:hypothetical protein
MNISIEELRLLLNLRKDVEQEYMAEKESPRRPIMEAPITVDAVDEETDIESGAIDEETDIESGAIDEETDIESGYIVVDTSTGWERALHFTEQGWLGGSSVSFPVTVFYTKVAARAAIISTNNYNGGKYAWSHNDFRVLPFNNS